MAAALGLGGVPDALVGGGARLACHDAWVDRAWWWGWGVGFGVYLATVTQPLLCHLEEPSVMSQASRWLVISIMSKSKASCTDASRL